jgi:hypothetical protein
MPCETYARDLDLVPPERRIKNSRDRWWFGGKKGLGAAGSGHGDVEVVGNGAPSLSSRDGCSVTLARHRKIYQIVGKRRQ